MTDVRAATGGTAGAAWRAAGLASAAALRGQLGEAVQRIHESCGQAIVTVDAGAAAAALRWLRTDPGQDYDYLADLTCVEYRDPERPLEVVYQLRSLSRGADLRLKIPLDPDAELEVQSVVDLWAGADWLEREAFDMFGVRFRGHPDLRRILMWENYDEGHPLRKSFPLRGHRSRSEQTRQALAGDPEAHYSPEELEIADAYGELPGELHGRLAAEREEEGA